MFSVEKILRMSISLDDIYDKDFVMSCQNDNDSLNDPIVRVVISRQWFFNPMQLNTFDFLLIFADQYRFD